MLSYWAHKVKTKNVDKQLCGLTAERNSGNSYEQNSGLATSKTDSPPQAPKGKNKDDTAVAATTTKPSKQILHNVNSDAHTHTHDTV